MEQCYGLSKNTDHLVSVLKLLCSPLLPGIWLLRSHALSEQGLSFLCFVSRCDYCNKGFKKSSHLKQHVRSHTGEKPYKCKLCGRGFVSSGVLKSHEKTHTGYCLFPVERSYRLNVFSGLIISLRTVLCSRFICAIACVSTMILFMVCNIALDR